MKRKVKIHLWCIISMMLLTTASVSAQTKAVKGSVTDAATGEALIGASVVVKGASTGTITDYDGNFSLEMSGRKTLVISYVGYTTKEIAASAGTTVKVSLQPDSKMVDELVVIGYGQQKKVTVTGSISNVSGKELLKSPVPSLGNALAGKLPGVSTVQYSGAPGADDPNIFIRGQASLNGSNPLVLVDGV